MSLFHFFISFGDGRVAWKTAGSVTFTGNRMLQYNFTKHFLKLTGYNFKPVKYLLIKYETDFLWNNKDNKLIKVMWFCFKGVKLGL
jgi:hypothetical protein